MLLGAANSSVSFSPNLIFLLGTDSLNSFNTGWVIYNYPVPLWINSNSSHVLANFNSYFRFSIYGNEARGSGDGLAFFMAPFDFEPPVNANGQWLGLFNHTSDGKISNQIVAVEFDTFKNFPFDMDDNHVGIDVNSVVSKMNTSVIQGLLRNGESWDAWVDYDGVAKKLELYLLCPNNPYSSYGKPPTPTLSYDIDLSQFLPQNITIGFSASSSRNSTGIYEVYFWNFSCEYPWEINTQREGPVPAPSKRPTNKVILLSVIACMVALTIGGFTLCLGLKRCLITRNLSKHGKKESRELDEGFAQGPRKFSYAELCTATKSFSDTEMLGRGGFGGVYRGTLPESNKPVAVKRISQGSKQGRKEYISEVSIISKLCHRNLVQLYGWCHEKGQLLLVYEFLPNGSLDKHIFGEQMRHNLNWDQRYSIACDIASALLYLHQEWNQRVVHRDVKASNVMLDSDFNAKLGDFGLARVVERERAASDTTVVAGTFGYIAPECVTTGKASIESDMFSFGAVSLEIACGRRAVDRRLEEHYCRLVEWVWDLYGQGNVLDAADAKLGGNYHAEEMERLMLVGLLCSHPDPKARLRIRQVVHILKMKAPVPRIPLTYPVAVYDAAPGFVVKLSSTSDQIFCTAENTGSIGDK
ncbi:L-type lectin-domain containing receptor kinase IX.1-like [Cryptomeria japonica]|uniref:L-type lectin-domain containing receptor kinase IX.1-like n=1 Tax=Cryptomeria japonica TaxID=3369 RepID=UPI0027DA6D92|nr:L-type lectin-domain containing receptor kinase IX.1-like [Cryptomeria japonica]